MRTSGIVCFGISRLWSGYVLSKRMFTHPGNDDREEER